MTVFATPLPFIPGYYDSIHAIELDICAPTNGPYGLFVMDISILFGRCQPTRTILVFILGDVTLKHRRGTVVQKSLACLENRSSVQCSIALSLDILVVVHHNLRVFMKLFRDFDWIYSENP